MQITESQNDKIFVLASLFLQVIFVSKMGIFASVNQNWPSRRKKPRFFPVYFSPLPLLNFS